MKLSTMASNQSGDDTASELRATRQAACWTDPQASLPLHPQQQAPPRSGVWAEPSPLPMADLPPPLPMTPKLKARPPPPWHNADSSHTQLHPPPLPPSHKADSSHTLPMPLPTEKGPPPPWRQQQADRDQQPHSTQRPFLSPTQGPPPQDHPPTPKVKGPPPKGPPPVLHAHSPFDTEQSSHPWPSSRSRRRS